MQKEIEMILIDILSRELELPLVYGKDKKNNDIPVFVRGFNDAKLGKIKELQIVVTELNKKVMSSNSKIDFTVDPPIERQSVQLSSFIQIDLVSKNRDAVNRGWEVITGLTSNYSKRMQEKYNLKIFKIPQSFNNTSGAEGGSNLNRYTIVISSFIWQYKEKILTEYFNSFQTKADNENSLGNGTGIEIEEGENL